jgi:hypothetical protein
MKLIISKVNGYSQCEIIKMSMYVVYPLADDKMKK